VKVAVLRNTPTAQVLNPFGRRNREYYRESDIETIHRALTEAGHRSAVFEADINLIPSLEVFFGPRGSGGYREGLAFNLAYGVQGECRYTHIPSLLELAGVPYVGSGPLANTVCLDKYLAKVVFRHAELPTPNFQLFPSAGHVRREDLAFPLIVKPQYESTSVGISVVQDDEELRNAVAVLIEEFGQPALIEDFVDGIEVNCGVLGNSPPEALPVVEIDFGGRKGSGAIMSHESKRDRAISHVCPARLPDAVTARVQQLAIAAFKATGCRDAARVDFRIDSGGEPQILEVNSMVALHSEGSLYHAARVQGMTYGDLVLRVLEAAAVRARAGAAPKMVRLA
jgi:D-alanine-D-alanine ligase